MEDHYDYEKDYEYERDHFDTSSIKLDEIEIFTTCFFGSVVLFFFGSLIYVIISNIWSWL